MNIIKTVSELRAWREPLWPQGKTLSYVPTMGALHDGHMALVKDGLSRSDVCLPYIFLNPKQFSKNEDLDKYPKKLDDDLDKLSTQGIDTVYIPNIDEVYPSAFQTTVSVSDITRPLEGECRPNFFAGVTTVVAKMLLQCLPDFAIFGEKDFQQLKVIERMVRDLNIPVEVIGHPTIRDENGLALSSRNQYLSSDEYEIAIQLNKIILQITKNELSELQASKNLLEAGFDKIDYCTVRNSETFLSKNPNRVFAAAWIGDTRLIDNIALTA